MNIAYLSGTTIPSRAASALHAVKMAQALALREHSSALYGFSNPTTSDSIASFYGIQSAFEAHLFKPPPVPRGWSYYFAVRCLASEMLQARDRQADVFYGRHARGLLLISRRNRPFAYEAHVLPQSPNTLALEAKLLSRPNARALVCISNALADDYRKALNPSVPIHVIPDAADAVDRASSRPPPISPWPGRADATQVGYVGHLYPGKGMEVIHQLAPRAPEMDFHIIGGQIEDIQSWQARTTANNVHFHGYVAHHRLPAYYQRLDIALLPNQAEVSGAASNSEIGRWTSPLKAFEYMSMGVAIIASATPALLEILQADVSALVAEPTDIDRWEHQLRRLATDPALRRAIASRAQITFDRAHTWDVRAQAIVGLFQ